MYDNKYIYNNCNNSSYINKEFCDEKTLFKDLNKFLTLIKEYKEYILPYENIFNKLILNNEFGFDNIINNIEYYTVYPSKNMLNE